MGFTMANQVGLENNLIPLLGKNLRYQLVTHI